MNSKAKGSRNERRTRKDLKELGYSLLGVLLAMIIIVFVMGAWFISPLVSYVWRVRRKLVESEK